MEKRVLLKINREINLRRKKANGAILKSFKGNLIADFRHKDDSYEVIDISVYVRAYFCLSKKDRKSYYFQE